MTDADTRPEIKEGITGMKYNVLVFPAGTEIAFEIRQALKDSKFIKLFGATSVPCHADFVFEKCFGVPPIDDPNCIYSLNSITDDYGIDFIYPAHDDVLLHLTFHQKELKARVVTSPKPTVMICRDKKKTYRTLEGRDYIPKTWMNVTDIPDSEYPVFVKPAVGQGSKDAVLVQDRKHLYEIVSDQRDYAICEYLPGKEYTVDCFTDRHGKLRYIGQRTRERIRSGIAVRSQFVRPTDEAVLTIAEDLNKFFSINGAWFFQLKEDRKGKLKLLEIAPRIAGTMGLSRNIGVNLPLLTMYNMWDMDTDIVTNADNILLLDRAFISRFKSNIEYDTVYVDFDDTLIQDGEVNPYLIAFLYQSHDKGKRLVLLTKHSGNIFDRLGSHSIDASLFDSIISLKKNTDKADFISGKSIFIDDSFSERKRVHEKCSIPVFDLDAVESLFDWRA